MQEQLLALLARGDGSILGPLEDNSTFDSITLDGTGGVTAKANFTPPKISNQEQLPLEAFDLGAFDLLDF